MAMRYAKRTGWWYVLAICVQSVTLWVAQPVSAGIESYDPRLDPNYTRATSGNPSIDWRAVETFSREFQARSALIGSQPSTGGYYAPPQPWHYVWAEYPATVPQTDYTGYGYWAPPVGGPYYPYWYGSDIYGWWAPSPRVPWWSLVPSRHHHRPSAHLRFHGRHGGVMGHRGW